MSMQHYERGRASVPIVEHVESKRPHVDRTALGDWQRWRKRHEGTACQTIDENAAKNPPLRPLRCKAAPVSSRLLVVHQSRGGTTTQLVDAFCAGVSDPELERTVEIERRPALEAQPAEVLAADVIVLATPEHFGYMSGALKHFLETIYYPLQDLTTAKPWALLVNADNDGSGAVTSIERIVAGLGWKLAYPPLIAVGPPNETHLAEALELGRMIGASMESDLL
jgi:hypothetical protein